MFRNLLVKENFQTTRSKNTDQHDWNSFNTREYNQKHSTLSMNAIIFNHNRKNIFLNFCWSQ
jgi:hypothetical protein